MDKAAASDADIVIFDIEDSVAPDRKPLAREMIAAFLSAQDEAARARLWVRVNPLDGPHSRADLDAVMPAGPGGIMLPKASGRGDVEALDAMIAAYDAATPVCALVTETAAAMFTTGDYDGAPRLAAMSWGAEDLADSIGAMSNLRDDGSYGFTYELARSLCLLGASAAGVPAIETIYGDFRNSDGLKRRAEQVRRDGYRGMLAIHPDQVPVINAAFTPSDAEIAQAREIVELFAANPDAGTLSLDGKMLDRPHHSRALLLLRQAAG